MAPLWNRVLLLVGRAVLTAIDDTEGLQLVQITGLRDEVRDGLPRLQNYGFSSVPLPGAYALAIFQGGDRAFGAVAVADDPRYRPTGWAPGETGMYDWLGKFIRLRADGTLEISAPKIVLNAGERIELNAGEDLRLYAGVSYRQDVHGYAEQLDWTAGTIWQPYTWHTGATLSASIDSAIDPPKVEEA